MPVRASKRAPTVLWAAAIAALAPNAFAHTHDTPQGPDLEPAAGLKIGVDARGWSLVRAAARADGQGIGFRAELASARGAPLSAALNGPALAAIQLGAVPLGEPGLYAESLADANPAARFFSSIAYPSAPPPAGAYLEASAHALAVRYGAPLATAAARETASDLWTEAAAPEPAAAPAPPPVVLTPAPAPADGAVVLTPAPGPVADAPVVLQPASPTPAAGADFVQDLTPAPEAPIVVATLHPVDAPPGPLVPLDAADGAAADGGADPMAPKPVDPPRDRRRPGATRGQPSLIPTPTQQTDPNAVPPASSKDIEACEEIAAGVDPVQNTRCAPPIPDRWRLIENLGVIKERWWDPYHQNTLKGDRPILGTQDLFLILSAVSDTVVEPRSFPIPVGVQTTSRAGSLDVFGDANSYVLSQTFIVGASIVQGSTAFKPQEHEFRVAFAWNVNYAEVEEKRILNVRPDAGTTRNDSFIGVQEFFYEDHLRNVSERYDFDSLRIGIQPFSSDFRGFLFQDNQLGVRLFGTRNNNRFQYNLAAFWRLEKDTNSGLNDVSVEPRDDYVFIANAYRQDLPMPGFTSQITAAYNRNRESGVVHVDKNGFPARPSLIGNLLPRDYDVGYVGYNGDGHFGRWNLTASAYYAFGKDRNNIFTGKESVIRSYFVAMEPSIDFDWIRVRGSALYGSGDDNPYDDRNEGFDAIFENPQFAGADTSFWIRQSVPFIGGGRAVSLNGRNGILNSLRSSKEEGQSNFINPGIALLGVGADFDILPELRVSTSVNHLAFATTEPLQALRQDGSIRKEIGWDVSAAATYRPGFIQNFVFRLSGAALLPGDGFKDIYDNVEKHDAYYSVLFNATLSY